MPLIEFQNVSKSFGDNSIIKNVSFKIEKGALTTLIGPNGAGKTTLARLMLGLEEPTSGNIYIPSTLKINYVPQKFDFSCNLPMTASTFINLISSSPSMNEAYKFLSLINFENIAKKNITSLSGGEFQKLLLTASFINKPDLLILDEPTQFLDVLSQQEFYNIIERIRKEYNTTIFMISHDLFTVMKNSDQVICLNGHVCCSGKPGDLKSSPEFIEALSMLGIYSHSHDHQH